MITPSTILETIIMLFLAVGVAKAVNRVTGTNHHSKD